MQGNKESGVTGRQIYAKGRMRKPSLLHLTPSPIILNLSHQGPRIDNTDSFATLPSYLTFPPSQDH